MTGDRKRKLSDSLFLSIFLLVDPFAAVVPEYHEEEQEEYPAHIRVEHVDCKLRADEDANEHEKVDPQDVVQDSSDNSRNEQEGHPFLVYPVPVEDKKYCID